MSPAKMAELIKMLFGGLTRMVPGNHVLDGASIPKRGRGNLFWLHCDCSI